MEYPPVIEFVLQSFEQFNFLNATIIIVSIGFVFTLNIKNTIISGIIGTIIYYYNDISILFVSTRALGLRIFVLAFYLGIQISLLYFYFNPNNKEINNIKKIVIDISDKFTITTIKDVSERSKSDNDLIKKTVNNMISNGEINADFFRRSKTIAFYK